MRKALGRLATLACIGVMLFAVGALFLPTALGYKRYVITGGSMTGTIPKGAVIYSRLVPTEQLKPGDIITFVPPEFAAPVTHRITAASPDEYGHLVVTTKGDFNPVGDPWRLRFVDPVQARYAFHIPYLGYGLAILGTRQVRMLLIGLPAIVIAFSLLWSLWRQAGDELERLEEEAAGRGPAGASTDGDGVGADCTPVLVLDWEGPDPFDGKTEAELADLRGWWS